MQILYLTHGFPFPLTSGYLRHYYLIRELARRHRITLVSSVRPGFQTAHAEAMAPFVDRVLTFASQARGATPAHRVVRRVRASLCGDGVFRRMHAALQTTLRSVAFDAVVLSGRPTYRAVAGLALPPMVADLCDATLIRLKGEQEHAHAIRRAALWLDRLEVRRSERAILTRADHVLFASMRDRRAVPEAAHASVLPNGVDLEYWQRTRPTLGPATVVFTGAMNYAPNVDAALHLAQDIFPLVRRAVPSARLVLVGHSPPPSLVRAGAMPGITVTGFVDDVRPYLQAATVFAAPIRFGAGIQNKLLEALAMELPVVTTPVAADGLTAEDGTRPPVHIATTAEQLASAIALELVRRADCPAPLADGRDYVRRHFSWARSGDRLDAILTNAVNGRRAVPDAVAHA
jgi:glycosyltransferase involved in cell wall biosynthesis